MTPETYAYILAATLKLSGIPAPASAPPPVVAATREHLASEMCPDRPADCRGVVAMFDTERNRILLRDDMDPDDDEIAASFVVHELTHWLQFHRWGPRIYATCEATLRTEHDAYSVQNKYLAARGAMFKAGAVLWAMKCPKE